MSFISSIILRSVTVTSNKMDFTRPDIDVTKVAVKFKLRNELEEDKDSKSCKLTFSSDVIGKLTDGEGDDPDFDLVDNEFSFSLTVEYEFEIKDYEKFSSVDEDERTEACANIVYLDFRRRMTVGANNIGISSFRLPLSIMSLNKSKEKEKEKETE
ncbi:TPA: hypothetical protein ACGRPM_001271 [Proteus mirabilis]|uniref:hypothetical protein n=1 Tax=Proteus mirabilis TaxID=584 RepID=UPI001FF1545C|nr:hypothetical protein [Proteus mirabilis]MCJ8514982.1 hypothetical protein [Proteus mirabilis]